MNKQKIQKNLSEVPNLEDDAKKFCNIMLRTKKYRIFKKNFKKLCKIWGYEHKHYINRK